MRVLICPDKFAGTLSARRGGRGHRRRLAAARPGRRAGDRGRWPTAGPGFVDVLAAALRRQPACRCRPSTRSAARSTGEILLVDGDTAYVESAQACGLHLLDPDERDPNGTTSYGLGVLVARRGGGGRPTVVVGLGGSATNDGGAGMLAALGAAPLDEAGCALPYGGAALTRRRRARRAAPVRAGVAAGRRHRRRQPADRPARAPAASSARRRAPTAEDVLLLDAALERFAGVLEKDLPACPAGRRRRCPERGAAGGLGAALLALGGRLRVRASAWSRDG